MSKGISFFNQDSAFQPKNKRLLYNWLSNIVAAEGAKIEYVNYVFCSDEFLLDINIKFLNHDTFTDIITFEYNNKGEAIASDIYISIERCQENAKSLNISFMDEFHRLLAHGILHLLGYQDKTKNKKLIMTQKEDYYLSLRPIVLS